MKFNIIEKVYSIESTVSPMMSLMFFQCLLIAPSNLEMLSLAVLAKANLKMLISLTPKLVVTTPSTIQFLPLLLVELDWEIL